MKIIRFIKNILIIVCLSFSILTSISKCHAYTFEQFEQFINACYDNNITTSAMSKDSLNVAKNYFYNIKDYIKNNNLDISNYTSFALYSNGYTAGTINHFSIYFYSGYVNYGRNDSRTSFINIEGSGIYITDTGSKYNIPNGWTNDFRCGIFANDCPYGQSNVSNALTQYKWNPNDHPLIAPFSFTPYGILTNDDWYYQKFSYTGNICLGELGDNEFYQLDIKLKNPNGVQLGVISIVPDVRLY